MRNNSSLWKCFIPKYWGVPYVHQSLFVHFRVSPHFFHFVLSLSTMKSSRPLGVANAPSYPTIYPRAWVSRRELQPCLLWSDVKVSTIGWVHCVKPYNISSKGTFASGGNRDNIQIFRLAIALLRVSYGQMLVNTSHQVSGLRHLIRSILYAIIR